MMFWPYETEATQFCTECEVFGKQAPCWACGRRRYLVVRAVSVTTYRGAKMDEILDLPLS